MVISAVFYDGYAKNDADEAVQIWNTGPDPIDLAGWTLNDSNGRAAFVGRAVLAPRHWWWLAREGPAFTRSFGSVPDWVWGGSVAGLTSAKMATVGGGPALANDGDALALRSPDGSLVDGIVFGRNGDRGRVPADWDWSGPPAVPYHGGVLGSTHQVLYRKLDPSTGLPTSAGLAISTALPTTTGLSISAGPPISTGLSLSIGLPTGLDSSGPRFHPAIPPHSIADWSSDPEDARLGRRVRYPGWDLEGALVPTLVDGGAPGGRASFLEVAVAPDALYAFLSRYLGAARSSIDLLVYTFENPDLAELMAQRIAAGVHVRILVDGAPTGGIDPNQRWCLARIAAAGGAVYWLADGGEVGERYRSMHAKLIVIDGRIALIGSENPNLGATPSDDLSDGTAGRRGVYLATDAPAVVGWAEALAGRDLDPVLHVDLRPFQPRDPVRGAPAPDFVPVRTGGGAGYRPIAPEPLRLVFPGKGPMTDSVIGKVFDSMTDSITNRMPGSTTSRVIGRVTGPAIGREIGTGSVAAPNFELISAPENAIHPAAGLLGLLAKVAAGDTLWVEQMDEPVWWGDGPGEGPVALNPRLDGYLAAARRGAAVRVLLDGYFDDPAYPNSNTASAAYLNAAAVAERLDLEALVGNPTGQGIHNKMVLVALDGPGHTGAPSYWTHLGSLNGSEVASKANREVALNVDSAAVYGYLGAVWKWDWVKSGANAVYLPSMVR